MQEVNKLCIEFLFVVTAFLIMECFLCFFLSHDTQLEHYPEVYNQLRKNIKSRICLSLLTAS